MRDRCKQEESINDTSAVVCPEERRNRKEDRRRWNKRGKTRGKTEKRNRK